MNSFIFNSLYLLLFFLSSTLIAQAVYTPADDNVYDFLERISLKKIIQYHNEVKPLSRKEISEYLKSIAIGEQFLNNVEKTELKFYQQEYANEMGLTEGERWFLYKYSDTLFSFRLSPIAGYGINSLYKASGHERWWGARLYSSYSDWFGASLYMRDNGEFGDNTDPDKTFSAQQGNFVKKTKNGFEYTTVEGSISFNWKWGSISLKKEDINWGHGNYGQLILSSKPPSFPHLELRLKPTEWFRFYYIHGWLNSMILDSAAFYYTHFNSIQPALREKYHEKYIAANLFSFTPLDWLDISLGNSVVYSDGLRPEFFIPFMFFKFLDHNTGRGNVGDANGQMYFDFAVKYPETYFFYSTIFIDVTEIRNVFKKDFRNTWFGITLGGKKVNCIVDNLDLSLEYTRISPWTYEHRDQVTDYKHVNYTLGDWIGQNADQLHFELNYQFIRGLKIKSYFDAVRKGGLEDIYFAYNQKKNIPFLSGPLRKDKIFGLEVSYEYIHDLFGKLYFEYSDISDDDPARTPSFMLGKNQSIGLTIYYGR